MLDRAREGVPEGTLGRWGLDLTLWEGQDRRRGPGWGWGRMLAEESGLGVGRCGCVTLGKLPPSSGPPLLPGSISAAG